MPFFHLLVLAIAQGVTEFLPISSSGHLVLVWAGFEAAGSSPKDLSESIQLSFDVAVHVGTLLAVILYFRQDVALMFRGLGRLATDRKDHGAHLIVALVIGTLPIILVGFSAKEWIELALRNVEVVAWTTIFFGLLLYWADRFPVRIETLDHIKLSHVMWIGLAQVMALVPGTSRSGITMTAARFLGYDRANSAHFSMLLAIPTILGAGTLASIALIEADSLTLGWDAVLAAAIAFVVAWISIALLIGWLRRASFTPFVVYRLILGGFLLYWAYVGF
ncbi:MAG: undecaprenyl-diphosphate phosphatase [Pseudomonadota bacterium]